MDDNKELEEMAHDCEEAKSPNVADMLNQSRNELTAIRDKRKELDAIQADLDDLIERLNVFIGKSVGQTEDDGDGTERDEEGSVGIEKQDGPQEKDLLVDNLEKGDELRGELYTTRNGTEPPEVNWNAVGPLLQKHVEDLQRLQDLNDMTSNVVNRIRNITQVDKSVTESAKSGQNSLDSEVSQSTRAMEEETSKPDADEKEKN